LLLGAVVTMLVVITAVIIIIVVTVIIVSVEPKVTALPVAVTAKTVLILDVALRH
jgi:hypothetical protein